MREPREERPEPAEDVSDEGVAGTEPDGMERPAEGTAMRPSGTWYTIFGPWRTSKTA